MKERLLHLQPHLCFTEEVCVSEDYECDMHVDMDALSEEESCDGEEAEEGECDTVTMTDVGADAERYDEKMDFVEEEETMKKIKGKYRMEEVQQSLFISITVFTLLQQNNLITINCM